MRQVVRVAIGLGWLLGSATAADADQPAPALSPSDPLQIPPWARKNSGLKTNPSVDIPVTVGATVTWLTLELLRKPLAPVNCRWCDLESDGSDGLNGFDRSIRESLRWTDVDTADTLSGAFSFVLAPAAGLGIGAIIAEHDDRLAELPEDLLVVVQSAMLASSVNGITKLVAARQRPDVHAAVLAGTPREAETGDNLSFFSGHATLAFALAVSAGTVASMRRHRWAPLMWASGLLFASTGSYLRIAADRHYATDVLTGVAVGSAFGFAVPYFFHQPGPSPIALTLTPLQVRSGAGLGVAGTF